MIIYLQHFEDYAKQVLKGDEIKGGIGPFRDAAHQLEGYLKIRYIPDLEKDILTLRRWEKDYLLRHDLKYVERVQSAVITIKKNIISSQISVENKKILSALINQYDKDFLALVEENKRISTLTANMRNAVHKIEPLVMANVNDAIMHMERETEEIRNTSRNRALFALLLSLLALLTAFFFSVVITRRITIPLSTLMSLAEIHTDDEDQISRDLENKDEMRALASAMGRMDGALTMTFNRLSKEVESIDHNTKELFQISNEITSKTEMETLGNAVKNQAEKVATAVAEIKATLLPRL